MLKSQIGFIGRPLRRYAISVSRAKNLLKWKFCRPRISQSELILVRPDGGAYTIPIIQVGSEYIVPKGLIDLLLCDPLPVPQEGERIEGVLEHQCLP